MDPGAETEKVKYGKKIKPDDRHVTRHDEECALRRRWRGGGWGGGGGGEVQEEEKEAEEEVEVEEVEV
ncbi:unnamed protein product [Lampetra planeri]